MKKTLLITLSILFISSCGSVKQTKEAINTGNYSKAIFLAVKKLKNNKSKKGNQPYVLMLEEAYAKANERDLERINYLKKDANPENLEDIYKRYKDLENRQNRIKPLLPLKIDEQSRTASFIIVDYSNEIIEAKNNLSNYLYRKTLTSLKKANKNEVRNIYYDLEYIEKINPNFKNTRQLMQDAHSRGIDFVYVSVKNQTEKVIPKRLENDLLNFDTYGLNDIWTVYHSRKDKKINYDFALELSLRQISVSPEQIKEKEIIEEKQVKDGYKYLLDDNDNQVKDDLGNKIKVDNMITAHCELHQITQYKTSKVFGQVKFYDYNTNQYIKIFPIESEFSFIHIYANYKGDKRAIRKSLLDLIRKKVVPFPSNEQMIYDTGTDLKEKLKRIIIINKFRN